MAQWDPVVNEIFLKAIEADTPADRATVLDRSCGDNPELRRKVESLLHAHEAAGSFLDRPAPGLAADLAWPATQAVTWPAPSPAAGPTSDDRATDAIGPDPAPVVTSAPRPVAEGPGTQIGPYKLLQKLGEGGMGVVYMAEQEQPVRRKAALKIIKPGMDTAQVVARFEAERQALAMMDHPNIARVLDAGATGSGRPFFVMELVNGIPITDYCDRARLTPRERLELFIPTCRAIQHAHQKGIIHRDVKPSNVLVTLVDGRAVPKVIDFGIAKATDQRLTERTLFTQHGAVVGSFEYMSPEQAALSGVDIDTRSDVYSLGVLLYELLTGSTPLGHARLREAGYAEILRLIREEEPRKPSTRLSDSGEALPSIAATRGTEPTRLTRLVRGELDWIVMKSLEKDRARRYESAAGLARDVEKYLADEPVEACPPSKWYRLGKFARRHRTALAVAASFAALLVLASAVSIWLAMQARRERNRALAAEASARAESIRAANAERTTRSEAEKVKAINEFLTEDILTQAEPGKNAAESKVTLREVLDRAAGKVGERFREKPEVEIALRRAIYATYHGLGAWEKAEQQAVAKLELERRLHGDDGVESLLALTELGHIRDHLGRNREALDALNQADEGLRRRLAPDDPNAVAVRGNLAMAYESAGRTSQAIAIFEDLLRNHDDPNIPAIRENLAKAYRSAGRTTDAIAILEDLLRQTTTRMGPDHPDTLGFRMSLALAYLEVGQTAKAIPILEEVLKGMNARLGPDHPDTFAGVSNLASAYVAVGRVAEALPILERMLRQFEATLGPDDPRTLKVRNNLGGAYWTVGRIADATPLIEETYRRRAARFGPDHPETLTSRSNLAKIYMSTGRTAEAIPILEDTLKRMTAKLGPGHRYTLDTRETLAACYESAGRPGDAESQRRAILEARRRRRSVDPAALAGALSMLGQGLLAQRKFDEARPLLRESLEIHETAAPADWTTFEARSLLGACLLERREFAEAEPLLVSGYEGMKAREATIPAPDRPRLPEAAARVVRLYTDWGQSKKAEEWRQKQGPEGSRPPGPSRR